MDEDSLPISAVEHYAYCPRQAALILLDGVWAENVHTALGSDQHQAVDRESRLVRRDGIETWLSLPVVSKRLGVSGTCDAVEFRELPLPVEHKPVRTRHAAAAARQQLAIQAMCLEEMFNEPIPAGVIFAHREHRRQIIPLDADLRATALHTLESLTRMVRSHELPPRLDGARCRNCSLRHECQLETGPDRSGDPFTPRPEGEF